MRKLPFAAALSLLGAGFGCGPMTELGLVKPDRAIFEAVAIRLPVPAAAVGRVLFLDDNLVNVEGARACGFVARHVRGVDEARRALEADGVLAG